jgi:ATP-dependent DNA helicase RecG
MLNAAIQNLSGIGPKRAKLLENLGIRSVGDLLFHFPRDYQDRRHVVTIAEVAEGQTVTIEAEVVKSRMVRLRGRMNMAVVTLRDDTGDITATWFGRGFLANSMAAGRRGFFSGPVGQYKGLCLKNPEHELLEGDESDRLHSGRIVPIYPLTEKITQRLMRVLIAEALAVIAGQLPETLPENLRIRYSFAALQDALNRVHWPDSLEEARCARARFAYEELLGLQLGVLRTRAATHAQEGIVHTVDGPVLARLRASLPFALTEAQRRVIQDILHDMAAPRPMARLLQGDVGCGKTVVALHAVAAAVDGGYQAALMAPTELLAEQHYLTLLRQLDPLGLRVALLTGSTRGQRALREGIAQGDFDLVVGTHALLSETTAFHRLGLAVIDEQHRFGVAQRARLTDKGASVDVLHMTATPIPRTLCITVYGGMDVSVIDELPPGRLPVKTRRITPAKVPEMYRYICDQAAGGFQTYYICPLIEESESRELIAVTRHFEELSAGPFKDLRTAMVHGRIDPAARDHAMQSFNRGEVDILFSTTVIEVGIDVPNATTMVIEDAAQFGLTQLHQLRGRVGRGPEQSYCFLLGTPKTNDGKKRLEVMCATTSGFDIAEADLELRGPGELLGARQAGLTDLRIADLIRDVRLLEQARKDAEVILAGDPELAAPEYAALKQRAERFGAVSL